MYCNKNLAPYLNNYHLSKLFIIIFEIKLPLNEIK